MSLYNWDEVPEERLREDISRTCERALERRVAALRAFEGAEKLGSLEG